MEARVSLPPYVLAVDFGGTKLAAAVVDVARGELVVSARCPTPAGGAEASLAALIALAQAALRQSPGPVTAIGISFGGPVSADRRTVLRSMHVGAWEGISLPARLSAVLGLPAAMDNDGNLAALGEWAFGAGRGVRSLLYIQVSTGIGAGLVLEGQVYRGQGLAGEFGHLTVMPDGPCCSCGKRGCVESLASGWALARDGQAQLGGAPPPDAEQVLVAARAGNPVAQAIVRRAFTALGQGIAAAITLLDPELVVLGGGVARAEDWMRPLVTAALADYLPPMLQGRTRLEFSPLHGSETLLGAALLAVNEAR